MLKTKLFCFIFIFIISLTLISCSKIRDSFGITSVAGYYISQDKLDKIVLGITQKDVFNLLGSPSTVSIFDKNIWFYIYQKTWYIAVLKEKVINQQILILQFNNDGKLINIQYKTVKDSKNIKFDNKYTNFIYKKDTLEPDLFCGGK